ISGMLHLNASSVTTAMVISALPIDFRRRHLWQPTGFSIGKPPSPARRRRKPAPQSGGPGVGRNVASQPLPDPFGAAVRPHARGAAGTAASVDAPRRGLLGFRRPRAPWTRLTHLSGKRVEAWPGRTLPDRGIPRGPKPPSTRH